jgi:hypothetical protein
MPDLSIRRFRAVLDLGQKLRLDPDALVGHPLREGLRFSDERSQPLSQVRCGRLVEPVVHLAGIDQVIALAPADVEPVPLAAVERKSGDRQGLALRAGLTVAINQALSFGVIFQTDPLPHAGRGTNQELRSVAWSSA